MSDESLNEAVDPCEITEIEVRASKMLAYALLTGDIVTTRQKLAGTDREVLVLGILAPEYVVEDLGLADQIPEGEAALRPLAILIADEGSAWMFETPNLSSPERVAAAKAKQEARIAEREAEREASDVKLAEAFAASGDEIDPEAGAATWDPDLDAR